MRRYDKVFLLVIKTGFKKIMVSTLTFTQLTIICILSAGKKFWETFAAVALPRGLCAVDTVKSTLNVESK